MSKNSGTGSKRSGSHTNKGMGHCTGSHAKQCGSGIDLKNTHEHEIERKHGHPEVASHDIAPSKKISKEIHIKSDKDKL